LPEIEFLTSAPARSGRAIKVNRGQDGLIFIADMPVIAGKVNNKKVYPFSNF